MYIYTYTYILRSPYEGEHSCLFFFFFGYLNHERGHKDNFSGFGTRKNHNSVMDLGVVVMDKCIKMYLIVKM